jgi:hypothetical protein
MIPWRFRRARVGGIWWTAPITSDDRCDPIQKKIDILREEAQSTTNTTTRSRTPQGTWVNTGFTCESRCATVRISPPAFSSKHRNPSAAGQCSGLSPISTSHNGEAGSGDHRLDLVGRIRVPRKGRNRKPGEGGNFKYILVVAWETCTFSALEFRWKGDDKEREYVCREGNRGHVDLIYSWILLFVG